jgi:hypothetical protein
MAAADEGMWQTLRIVTIVAAGSLEQVMSVTSQQTTTSSEANTSVSRRTRVDAPHGASGNTEPSADKQAMDENDGPLAQALLEVADEPTPSLIAAVTGDTLDSRREQLQLQVSQLAGHLRERLREVDRREAGVNARASQLEADLRASRLWLRERENDFQQREQELKRRIEELEERFERAKSRDGHGGTVGNALHGVPASADDEDFDARQLELAEREHHAQLKETSLRERRFEHDRQSAALRHAQQVWEHQRQREQHELELDRTRLELEFQQRTAQREADWQASEKLLTQHAEAVDRDRAALLADRQAWEAHKRAEREALELEKQAASAELADRALRLDGRQEWIERQKAGLEQVRAEVLHLHRQSLEMRLIAEQLWSQLTGRLTPAEVTQAIAHLRLKLSEQYKLEEQHLDAKRGELVALGERLASQHAELKQLQTGLRDWNAARQAEIEQQAAALVERELALDAEEEQHRQSQHAWQADRRKFEQQIRELTAQLRSAPAAA